MLLVTEKKKCKSEHENKNVENQERWLAKAYTNDDINSEMKYMHKAQVFSLQLCSMHWEIILCSIIRIWYHQDDTV